MSMYKLTLFSLLLFSSVVGLSVTSNAELIDRGGGLVYDTDLDITWMQDANYSYTSGYSSGHMTWDEAMAWADQLEYGGYDDWRLPATVDDYAVWGYDGTTTEGYNITTSEMGYMYYANLGNLGYWAKDGTHPQSGWGLNNTGPFINVQSGELPSGIFYWSITEVSTHADHVWYFSFIDGNQTVTNKVPNSIYGYVWAVRDGDSSPPIVPEPISFILFVTGGTFLVGRRFIKKNKKA